MTDNHKRHNKLHTTKKYNGPSKRGSQRPNTQTHTNTTHVNTRTHARTRTRTHTHTHTHPQSTAHDTTHKAHDGPNSERTQRTQPTHERHNGPNALTNTHTRARKTQCQYTHSLNKISPPPPVHAQCFQTVERKLSVHDTASAYHCIATWGPQKHTTE